MNEILEIFKTTIGLDVAVQEGLVHARLAKAIWSVYIMQLYVKLL